MMRVRSGRRATDDGRAAPLAQALAEKKYVLSALWVLLMLVVAPVGAAHAASGWVWRVPITVHNEADADLNQVQVRVELNVVNFDFARAAEDLRDLRFTEADGVRWLPHWLESYDRAAQRAVVWVKVGHVPAHGTAEIFAYYGNADAHDLSSGFRTFEFFDNFDHGGVGYFEVGSPSTIAQKDQSWETQAPHTLSVVELNLEGYRYWGYYGLADCGGIGLLRSNDLVKWDKQPAPLLNQDGERWPSAHYDGRTLFMVYDRDHCGTSHVALRESTDGRSFSESYTVLVAQEPGVRNQNPHLFWNAADGFYYLYWFRGGEAQGVWQIKARRARAPRELADPASEVVLMEEPYTLAAPNMMLRDGVYYFSTEVNENAWKTKIYVGPTPFGPFEPLPGAIILSNNEACWFQHIFEGVLHGFYCKDTRGDGQGWVLQHRVAELTQRSNERHVDGTFWSGNDDGAWRIETNAVGIVEVAGGVLRGAPGAQLRANLPYDDAKIAEVEICAGEGCSLETVQRVDGYAVLTGGSDVAYDNFRLRKRAVPEPTAQIGRPQVRSAAEQAWFRVGLDVSESGAPLTAPGWASVVGVAVLLICAGLVAGRGAGVALPVAGKPEPTS